MAALVASLLSPLAKKSRARRALARLGSKAPALSSRHVLLAVAAGSVAVLLVAVERRRRAQRASDERARLLGNGPFRWVADDEDSPSPALPSARAAASRAAPPAATRAPLDGARSGGAARQVAATRTDPVSAQGSSLWKVPKYSTELPLPGVQRTAPPPDLGQPSELRRLALDLAHAGLEAEAGLIENYALLLERSNASRERVIAEVTRMLRAAVVDRESTRRLARPRSGAVSPAPAPVPGGQMLPPAMPTSATSSSGASSSAAAAAVSDVPARAARAVIPLPASPVRAWRRAGR